MSELILAMGVPGSGKSTFIKKRLRDIDTYISRDVRELTQVGDELSFRKFMVSVASRTGEQLNYTSLADDAGISVPTAIKWLSILVTSGIVYLLDPFMSSELKRLTHIPKIIFMDTGLAC